MSSDIRDLYRKVESLHQNTKYSSLSVAISKVLNDKGIDDKEKLMRIRIYISDYFEWISDDLEDVL